MTFLHCSLYTMSICLDISQPFFFFSSFQKLTHFLQALCLFFFLNRCTGAITADICMAACKNPYFYSHIWVCKMCTKYKPLGVSMCMSACTKTEINPLALGEICTACFTRKPSIMKTICRNICIGRTAYETGMLCKTCDYNGFETCTTWPLKRKCDVSP